MQEIFFFKEWLYSLEMESIFLYHYFFIHYQLK